MSEQQTIPASWVLGYVEPDYDVFIDNMWQSEIDAREEQTNLAELTAYFYAGVM